MVSNSSEPLLKDRPAGSICFIILSAVLVLLVTSIEKSASEPLRQIIITSRALKSAESIPTAYTCSGEDISPALSWTGVPTEAQSLVLIVQDPDAPSGVFTHWIAYNLPGNLTGLPEGAARTSGLLKTNQGINDFRRIGYNGPCPPPGKAHHYHFQLFALDKRLRFDDPPRAAQVLSAARGHIIAQGELVPIYSR